MEAMIIVAGAVISLVAIAVLWQLCTSPRQPESLEAIVKRTVEATVPSLEWAVRDFAVKWPDDIRKGCQIHINVRSSDNSRLPPEYLKAFEKAGGGNGQHKTAS